ncbi:MAG TPA: acyloxyacyl hydrolase [Terriglobales bacterium]|nr:acyloxyacyl hydrolase [Terriglobales bacterium]
MKARWLVLFVLCASVMVVGQDGHALKKPVWEIGPWVGGGTGLGAASEFKFVNAGVRFGRVLTHEIGDGKFRGTFEWAADVMPIYYVRQSEFYDSGPQKWIYAFSMNPVVLKWNWTANKKVVPYFAAEGGMLISKQDIPQADTSSFNFTPGGAFGIYWFTSPRRAWDFSVHVTHISNASLADHNPGINATMQFRIGYTWFK